ncbi:TetR/AcrR family transcriptional regulator [Phycicoccus sp. BSK3Z-2]|uniref:TetR/AcrR family transcriptional regulator n=1 Tax=Phycicoccus avicenniae TaxID=2828860 RepID=A0A941D4Q2_9MICO|nr:TetR/AcrR family transcriptional regulator [Phycicoccus avicenniae]MBR7741850.1 TetR/AcrR family transcriptional regulator [Phycicoccus avicenniae]
MSGTSSQRRPRIDGQRNRAAVLAGAKTVFAARPDSYVSMADIARATGVGVGTVYRHFSSRSELLEAVFTEEVDRVCAQARPLDGRSPGASLEAWLRTFFAFARERNHVSLELIADIGVDTILFREDRSRFCAAGGPLLDAAQRSGEVGHRLDIGQVLDALVWLARGQGDDDHVRPIVEVFLAGLREPARTD